MARDIVLYGRPILMHLRFHSVVVSCVADDSSAHTPFGVLGFLLGTGALPLWLAVPFADDPKEYNRKIWRRKANTKLEEEIEELQIISDVSFLSCLVSRGYDTHNVQAGLFRFIYVFFFPSRTLAARNAGRCLARNAFLMAMDTRCDSN